MLVDSKQVRVTTTTAPSTVMAGASAAPGSASECARSDHAHAIAVGSSSSTVCVGDDARLSDDRTGSGIRTATSVVLVSSAAAPSAGQVLTATSSTAASWAAASGGSVTTTLLEIDSLSIGSGTPADVIGVSFPIAAGKTYRFDVSGLLSQTTAATVSFGMVLVAGGTVRRHYAVQIGATNAGTTTSGALIGASVAAGAVNLPWSVRGLAVVNVSGTLKLVAQRTAASLTLTGTAAIITARDS